jgi:hypothetical protein
MITTGIAIACSGLPMCAFVFCYQVTNDQNIPFHGERIVHYKRQLNKSELGKDRDRDPKEYIGKSNVKKTN